MISAKVIADNVNPSGNRLTTLELTYPRFIHSELMTHRLLSRNAASSRAIPISRFIKSVLSDPALPISWGANRPGMQALSDLLGWRRILAQRLFLLARFPAVLIAWLLSKIGLHKQIVNRLLEPWMHIVIVCSATEWENFFKLRLHPDAQPEFQELARCIRFAMDESVPQVLEWGMWHQPYLEPVDWAITASLGRDERSDLLPDTVFMSVARCAAVSYVRQGEKRDPRKDIDLSIRLRDSGHWSPFEHVAQAEPGRFGNFFGWKQLRSFYKETGLDLSDPSVPRDRRPEGPKGDSSV